MIGIMLIQWCILYLQRHERDCERLARCSLATFDVIVAEKR